MNISRCFDTQEIGTPPLTMRATVAFLSRFRASLCTRHGSHPQGWTSVKGIFGRFKWGDHRIAFQNSKGRFIWMMHAEHRSRKLTDRAHPELLAEKNRDDRLFFAFQWYISRWSVLTLRLDSTAPETRASESPCDMTAPSLFIDAFSYPLYLSFVVYHISIGRMSQGLSLQSAVSIASCITVHCFTARRTN